MPPGHLSFAKIKTALIRVGTSALLWLDDVPILVVKNCCCLSVLDRFLFQQYSIFVKIICFKYLVSFMPFFKCFDIALLIKKSNIERVALLF